MAINHHITVRKDSLGAIGISVVGIGISDRDIFVVVKGIFVVDIGGTSVAGTGEEVIDTSGVEDTGVAVTKVAIVTDD